MLALDRVESDFFRAKGTLLKLGKGWRGRWSVGWQWHSTSAGNLDLLIAFGAVHDHCRSSLLNGKILTTARTVEMDVHTTRASRRSVGNSYFNRKPISAVTGRQCKRLLRACRR